MATARRRRRRRVPPPRPAAPARWGWTRNYCYRRRRAALHRPKHDGAAPRARQGGGRACERAAAYAGGETPTRAMRLAPYRCCRCRGCRRMIQRGTPPTGGWMAQKGSATAAAGPAATRTRWPCQTKRRRGHRPPVPPPPRRHCRHRHHWFHRRRQQSWASPPPPRRPPTGTMATAGWRRCPTAAPAPSMPRSTTRRATRRATPTRATSPH